MVKLSSEQAENGFKNGGVGGVEYEDEYLNFCTFTNALNLMHSLGVYFGDIY